MTENNRDRKTKHGGLGLGATLLVAGGATALGVMAHDLWVKYNEYQAECSSSEGSKTPPGDWEHKRDNLETRKDHRTTTHDKNVPDEMKCVVCLDNPREVCLIPCGHVCLCENCSERVTEKCPVCNHAIENKKAIYI